MQGHQAVLDHSATFFFLCSDEKKVDKWRVASPSYARVEPFPPNSSHSSLSLTSFFFFKKKSGWPYSSQADMVICLTQVFFSFLSFRLLVVAIRFSSFSFPPSPFSSLSSSFFFLPVLLFSSSSLPSSSSSSFLPIFPFRFFLPYLLFIFRLFFPLIFVSLFLCYFLFSSNHTSSPPLSDEFCATVVSFCLQKRGR